MMPWVRALPSATVASLAALLAVALVAWRGAWSSSSSWTPGLHPQQQRRLGGASTSARLVLRECSKPSSGSESNFVLSFPSNPETSSYTLIPGSQEVFEAEVPITGSRPSAVALSISGNDGLCLQSASFDGVELHEGLPLWLDNPCVGTSDDYDGVPCRSKVVWQLSTTTPTSTASLATTTSTAQTTMTSATRTTTTTVTSSATSTTATATTLTTTTSSTSTTTLFVVLNPTIAPETPLTAFATAVAPPVFFDELHGELEINVRWSSSEPSQLADFEGPIVEAVTRFVGLAPPSAMRCRLRQPGSDRLVVDLDIRILPGSSTSAVDVQKLLRDPDERVRLNKLLALIRAPEGEEELTIATEGGLSMEPTGRTGALGSSTPDDEVQGGLSGNSSFAFLQTCEEGALFCCVRAVVGNIVENAGVVKAYRGYFLMAVLLSVAVCCVTLWATCPCPSGHETHSEEQRGRLVMPLFSIATSFQALLFIVKSVEKHLMLVQDCEEDTPLVACPPSPWAMVVEVLVFGGGLLLALAAFLLWWYRRWRSDCHTERMQRRLRRHVVSPLESMLRRSDFFALFEVRATDKASRKEFLLEVVLNVLLSVAVTLTSFFALQRYSFPNGLTAWLPYKLCYELCFSCALKIAVKKVARARLLGSFTFPFLCASIALLSAVNAYLWITIARTFVDLESGFHFHTWNIMRLLDIAVGAGIVNCILSPLSVSFAMYFFSVYAYEPHWRAHELQCVHLVNPEAQAGEVAALLDEDGGGSSKGSWELMGVRTARGEPVRLPQLPLKDESSEDDEESGEELAPCMGLPFSKSSRKTTAGRVADSLVDVAKSQPTRSQPLIVDLRKAGPKTFASRIVCICDYLLSVDSRLPVMQRSELDFDVQITEAEDEDDYETSDTDGRSRGSASETSGASATDSETSEEDSWKPPCESRA